MRKIFVFFLLTNFLFSVMLTVKIKNIDVKRPGRIYVFVSSEGDKFPFGKYKVDFSGLKKKTMYFKFRLPKGYYAISAYHDENNNKQFDQSFFGLKKEGYAYSNNYRSFPSFKKSRFLLKENDIIILEMIY